MLSGFWGLILLVGGVLGQWDPNFEDGHWGIVHLFEWHWDTIAEECETVLGPNKVGGVQISPPNENRIVGDRPWWERYQPVSYKLGTRSGDRQAFINMVKRCNDVGVRIYADAVINHMCGAGASGTGTAGSYFDENSFHFPSVPYGSLDFNDGNCYTSSGNIENYGDANQVRNCRLVSLVDLNQGTDYVRGKIQDFLNDLINIGVAGFRVDACKHMWPGDLNVIYSGLQDLNTDFFPAGGKAYLFQEVIDQGGEPITVHEYTGMGSVTEFKYGINLANQKDNIQNLENFGESWGMMTGTNALVFLNNHDNQRGHGGAGDPITFKDSYNLKIFSAFMLAWPYGVPRVMSSYDFSNGDQGPPDFQRSVESDGSCGNGWICEHRWRQIKNMFGFGAAVVGTGVSDFREWNKNQISFSRGNKGFLAINKANYPMEGKVNTGLPDGSYCNVIDGNFENGKCSGKCIAVSGGEAYLSIQNSNDPVVAIHVDAMTTMCEDGGNETGCAVEDNDKVDCGYMGMQQTECESSGCCWAESNTNGVPWCFNKA